jgi:hypothetical protein
VRFIEKYYIKTTFHVIMLCLFQEVHLHEPTVTVFSLLDLFNEKQVVACFDWQINNRCLTRFSK